MLYFIYFCFICSDLRIYKKILTAARTHPIKKETEKTTLFEDEFVQRKQIYVYELTTCETSISNYIYYTRFRTFKN